MSSRSHGRTPIAEVEDRLRAALAHRASTTPIAARDLAVRDAAVVELAEGRERRRARRPLLIVATAAATVAAMVAALIVVRTGSGDRPSIVSTAGGVRLAPGAYAEFEVTWLPEGYEPNPLPPIAVDADVAEWACLRHRVEEREVVCEEVIGDRTVGFAKMSGDEMVGYLNITTMFGDTGALSRFGGEPASEVRVAGREAQLRGGVDGSWVLSWEVREGVSLMVSGGAGLSADDLMRTAEGIREVGDTPDRIEMGFLVAEMDLASPFPPEATGHLVAGVGSDGLCVGVLSLATCKRVEVGGASAIDVPSADGSVIRTLLVGAVTAAVDRVVVERMDANPIELQIYDDPAGLGARFFGMTLDQGSLAVRAVALDDDGREIGAVALDPFGPPASESPVEVARGVTADVAWRLSAGRSGCVSLDTLGDSMSSCVGAAFGTGHAPAGVDAPWGSSDAPIGEAWRVAGLVYGTVDPDAVSVRVGGTEVATVGADAGLGAAFYVAPDPGPDFEVVSLAADGTEIDRHTFTGYE